ncbi:MAG: hypothetical protein ACI9QA_000621 [Methanobacteriota archaeon]|jgi:hypothetical protein|uniref:Uncharacterized protein n=1 Tax=Halorutilus salinus TaxID=2487751 RepID=A0A9Q4C5U9_9EURY|nr:hypothetical protein [Halorutilus salinus]MCX2818949.1 hypothetical protein [Halorutilus salinus]
MALSFSALEDFGTRSFVTHAMMVVTGSAGVLSALFIPGTVGDISFVAFLNFTAGLWVSQSVHSLGNSYTDDDYKGILKHLLEKI